MKVQDLAIADVKVGLKFYLRWQLATEEEATIVRIDRHIGDARHFRVLASRDSDGVTWPSFYDNEANYELVITPLFAFGKL